MTVGYARVSTKEHTVALQVDALKRAGCERIHAETVNGAATARPGGPRNCTTSCALPACPCSRSQ